MNRNFNNSEPMTKRRQDHEPPASIAEWGWKYHHLGIPTRRRLPDEIYLPQFKFYVSGFSTSPFGIEWMRFEKDSPISKLIRTVPHIAFEVRDIDHEISTHNLKVLTEPNSPGKWNQGRNGRTQRRSCGIN